MSFLATACTKEYVVNTATRVRGAALVSYEQGGHLLVLQLDDVREKVAAFLRLHDPK